VKSAWHVFRAGIMLTGGAILLLVVLFIMVAHHRSFPRRVMVDGHEFLDTRPGLTDAYQHSPNCWCGR